jgi:hypothetical protein
MGKVPVGTQLDAFCGLSPPFLRYINMPRKKKTEYAFSPHCAAAMLAYLPMTEAAFLSVHA